ncbi:MAG TPA: helix-turn-helix transcriptional regulator [Candidatus Acidoferrum sp.]|jgi:transcriptional regulator with XRE-family HTH domain|nr:helix-turn-helix transcriptional regulator [Candidatus Acidoferrum sp.]
MTLLRLGAMLRDRRGGKGIREVAKEIGISPATLTRVESGRLPDIATFQKICSWLKVNPAEILDITTTSNTTSTDTLVAAVHLRADQTLPEDAAADLAQLIVVASRELARRAQKRRVDVSAWL